MENKLSQYNVKPGTVKITILAILFALAIVLSMVDSMIPAMPFLPPGAKLGLSNIVTMYTASSIGLGSAIVIAVLKAIFVGTTRGMMAFLMSFFAGVLSTVVSGILLKMKKCPFGLVGIAVIGAVVHNLVQLAVVIIITNTIALIYYLPWLIIFALITGSLTGLALNIIMPLLNKLKLN